MTHQRPTEPRIPLVTEPDAEVRELLDTALTHDGSPLNIFGMLAHHPRLMKRFNLMGGFLLNKGLVPAREREIVILRIGWRARAVYEFGQHTIIGKAEGLSDAEIAGLAGASHDWSERDAALIAMADDLADDDCVSDATWAKLAPAWTEAQIIELIITAGFYRLVSGLLNSTGVPLDDGVPGWP
jgi:alkylhydroperoxidase family enzyme